MATINTSPFKDLYPFDSHWLNIDGNQYHYLDEGPRESPAIVMIHGNPTWSFYYRDLVKPLREKFRVIVPDHIGCGMSDKPQDYSYTIEQHIKNLEKLISHLQLKSLTLVMHDWGGGIGMGYAIRHPEKIARFIIFNTAVFMLSSIPRRIKICRSDHFGGFLVRRLNAFLKFAVRYGTSQRKRFTNAVKAGYMAPYNNWKNRIAIHRFVQEIPLESNHHTRVVVEELEAGLSNFRHHPMMILWGADDFTFSEKDVLPEWRVRFPGAKVEIIPNAGHFVVEDAHEKIVPRMMEFLQNHV
ncbi:MAG: alpha/beta fold hydrolase [Candidatus Hodarchaeales archaeon]